MFVCTCMCLYVCLTKKKIPWVCVLRCLRGPGRRLLLPLVSMSEGRGVFLDLLRESGDEVWLNLFLLLLSLSKPRDLAFLFILGMVGAGLLVSESKASEEERGRQKKKLRMSSHTLIMNVFSLFENDAFVSEGICVIGDMWWKKTNSMKAWMTFLTTQTV